MRKLLLVISGAFIFCSLACQSKRKPSSGNEGTVATKESIQKEDTKNNNSQEGAQAKKASKAGGDSISDGARAIKHGSAEQSKLDSLKNIKTIEKTKGK